MQKVVGCVSKEVPLLKEIQWLHGKVTWSLTDILTQRASRLRYSNILMVGAAWETQYTPTDLFELLSITIELNGNRSSFDESLH